MLRVLILFLWVCSCFPIFTPHNPQSWNPKAMHVWERTSQKKQTEQTALADAKKKAIEQVSVYIKSETHVKNFNSKKI